MIEAAVSEAVVVTVTASVFLSDSELTAVPVVDILDTVVDSELDTLGVTVVVVVIDVDVAALSFVSGFISAVIMSYKFYIKGYTYMYLRRKTRTT